MKEKEENLDYLINALENPYIVARDFADILDNSSPEEDKLREELIVALQNGNTEEAYKIHRKMLDLPKK